MKQKKIKAKERQQELLKNFEGDFYQEKKVGEKWLVKMFNGNTKNWQVAVYSEENFQKYKGFTELRRQEQHIRDISNR